MPAERFGLEIEFGFGTGSFDDVLRCFRAEGLEIEDNRYQHTGNSQTAWMLKYDGSLDSEGAEVVSPPLRFNEPEDREQVDRACRALVAAGATPIPSAGIHVHVSASDLNAFQLANICRFVYKFEDVLYRIASSGWKTIRPGAVREEYGDVEGYAKPISEEMVKLMQKVRTDAHLRRAWAGNDWSDDGDRYHAVNLNSFWIRGTVEFRLFNSSLYAERIHAYIAMCVAIVRDARNGRSRSVAKHFPLGYMHDNPDKQHAVWTRFRQIMTCPTADSTKSKSMGNPPLVSKQDWKRLIMCWHDSVPQAHPSVRGV